MNHNKTTENKLFRKEVLQKSNSNYFGKNIIIAPLTLYSWSIGLFTLSIVLLLFLSLAKFTKHHDVQGMIIPDKGLINIYAEKQGVVISNFLQQGDQVKKGDLLYLISTEHHDLTDKSVSVKLVNFLKDQLALQEKRINSLESNHSLYKSLFDKGLIKRSDYQNNYDNYLAAKQNLHDLEFKLQEVTSGSNYTIKSPGEGVISILTSKVGERVNNDSLLASIIPKEAQLQGILYVPSDIIGFIKKGQTVLIKYHAYPYQQFGLYEGEIDIIDKSMLLPADIKLPIAINSPFYRVVVKLKQQTVTVYGKSQSIVPGMMFNGVVIGEKRTILQWILDPILSLKGSF